MKKIIFTTLGLGSILVCFAQNPAEKKTSGYDSVSIVKVTDIDVDTRIDAYLKELDSLYKNYQFKNQTVKTNLLSNSKLIKDYILDLIENGGFNKVNELTQPAIIYDYKFKNSTLSIELDKYIKSINALDINETVKKQAIKNLSKFENMKRLNSYSPKYNAAITILKIQFSKVLWSEIYIIENESLDK